MSSCVSSGRDRDGRLSTTAASSSMTICSQRKSRTRGFERRQRLAVEQPASQRRPRPRRDERAGNDDEAMELDGSPRETRGMTGVDEGGREVIGLGLHRGAKALAPRRQPELAPDPPAGPRAGQDVESILTGPGLDRGRTFVGPRPRRIGLRRQAAAILQALRRDPKPCHDGARCEDRAAAERASILKQPRSIAGSTAPDS